MTTATWTNRQNEKKKVKILPPVFVTVEDELGKIFQVHRDDLSEIEHYDPEALRQTSNPLAS